MINIKKLCDYLLLLFLLNFNKNGKLDPSYEIMLLVTYFFIKYMGNIDCEFLLK